METRRTKRCFRLIARKRSFIAQIFTDLCIIMLMIDWQIIQTYLRYHAFYNASLCLKKQFGRGVDYWNQTFMAWHRYGLFFGIFLLVHLYKESPWQHTYMYNYYCCCNFQKQYIPSKQWHWTGTDFWTVF